MPSFAFASTTMPRRPICAWNSSFARWGAPGIGAGTPAMIGSSSEVSVSVTVVYLIG
jgi:hypothetical protein